MLHITIETRPIRAVGTLPKLVGCSSSCRRVRSFQGQRLSLWFPLGRSFLRHCLIFCSELNRIAIFQPSKKSLDTLSYTNNTKLSKIEMIRGQSICRGVVRWTNAIGLPTSCASKAWIVKGRENEEASWGNRAGISSPPPVLSFLLAPWFPAAWVFPAPPQISQFRPKGQKFNPNNLLKLYHITARLD